MKKKLLLLTTLLLIITLTPLATSYEITGDSTIDYGEVTSISVDCQNNPCAFQEDDYTLDICGGEYGISEEANTHEGTVTFTVEVPYDNDSDREVRCPVGTYEATVAGQNAGEIQIQHGYENGFDELYVAMDRDDMAVEGFKPSQGITQEGNVRVHQTGDSTIPYTSPNEAEETLQASTGVILGSTLTSSLDLFISETPSSSYVENVVEEEWDSDMDSSCAGSCVFTHETESGNADYSPDGQIIYGYEYDDEYDPSSTDSDARFYYCHEDDSTTWNTYVESPGNIHTYDYFRCSTSGQWENYNPETQCEDPAIGFVQQNLGGFGFDQYFSIGKGMIYGQSTEGAEYRDGLNFDCYYDTADTEIPGEYDEEDEEYREPTVYTCTQDGEIGQIIEGGWENDDYGTDREQEAGEYCETMQYSEDIYDDYGGEIPVTEYYVPISLIPDSIEDPGAATNYISGSGNYIGFANHFRQDLHEAKTSFYNVDDPMNASTWEERNMTNLHGYRNDGDLEEILEAWEPVRAGGQQSRNVATPNHLWPSSINDDNIFPGGWSGQCEGTGAGGETWNLITEEDNSDLQDDWACSDAVPWDFQIFMPTYNFEDSDTEENATVGFHLLPENFQQPGEPTDEITNQLTKTEWAALASVDPGYLEEENITEINNYASNGISAKDALIYLRSAAEQNGWVEDATESAESIIEHESMDIFESISSFSSPQHSTDYRQYYLYPRDGFMDGRGTPSPYIRDGCYNNRGFYPVDLSITAGLQPDNIDVEPHNRSFSVGGTNIEEHTMDCPDWLDEGIGITGPNAPNFDNLPRALESESIAEEVGQIDLDNPRISERTYVPDPGSERFWDSAQRNVVGHSPDEAQVDTIYSICWYGGRDRIEVLEDVNYGETWFSAEVNNIPEQPLRPIPIIGDLDKERASDYAGVTCRFVLVDEAGHSWRALGRIQQTGVHLDPMDDLAEQRNYEFSSDVDLGETMQPSEIEELSNEWIQETGVELEVYEDPEHPEISESVVRSGENNEYLRGEQDSE